MTIAPERPTTAALEQRLAEVERRITQLDQALDDSSPMGGWAEDALADRGVLLAEKAALLHQLGRTAEAHALHVELGLAA
ncbi:MAG TPA: hypothetical protein VI172_14745 [Candidatus Dormibacteraeota bacterium]|jgi:hypothetical protein